MLPLPIVYHTLVHLQTMSSPRASSVRIEPVSEPSTEAAPLEEPIATGAETIADSKPESDTQPFDFYAVCCKPVRNTYISQIRGKKHVCKSCPCHNPSLGQLFFKALSKPSSLLANAIHFPSFSYTLQDLRRIAVHPDYQHRGVG